MELQKVQDGRVDTQMLLRSREITKELDELHMLEESYWFSRSRAMEMKDGDKNTTYFHRKASHRKRRNGIKGLYDKHNVWREDKEDLEGVVEDYFAALFTSESPAGFN